MKKIATGRQIATIVRRACPLEVRGTPEGKLWLAVIEQALNEADYKDVAKHAGPRRYLKLGGFSLVCELLGLDAEFVQETIRDHAGWMRPA